MPLNIGTMGVCRELASVLGRDRNALSLTRRLASSRTLTACGGTGVREVTGLALAERSARDAVERFRPIAATSSRRDSARTPVGVGTRMWGVNRRHGSSSRRGTSRSGCPSTRRLRVAASLNTASLWKGSSAVRYWRPSASITSTEYEATIGMRISSCGSSGIQPARGQRSRRIARRVRALARRKTRASARPRDFAGSLGGEARPRQSGV
jgi:hypothetical protein